MSLRDDRHFSSLAVGRYTEYPVTRVIRQTAVTRLNDFSRCSYTLIRGADVTNCKAFIKILLRWLVSF